MRVKKLFYPHIIAHFLLVVNKKTSFFYPNANFFVLYKNERLQLCIFLENDGELVYNAEDAIEMLDEKC